MDSTVLILNTTPIVSTSNGTVTINANGTYTYTPSLNYVGPDSFVYEICNSETPVQCDQATVYITVEPIHYGPIAQKDTITLMEDAPATPIYVLADNGYGADDFGGNIPGSGTILVSVQPLHGTVVVNDNGTTGTQADDYLEYQPNADYQGVDSLKYKIFDAVGLNDEAVVVITILSVNDNPIAKDDYETFEETFEDQIFNVLANDTFGGDGANNTAISIIDMPYNGNAVVDDNGTASDPTDDYIIYAMTVEGTRSDSLTYQITDKDGDISIAKVHITITPNDVKVPHGFSPNGDGINDVLVIKG